VIFANLNDFGCFVERHFAHRSAARAPTQRNGETFAIGLVRTAPAKMSRPCNIDQNCRGRRISNYWRTAAANQSILRCWGKKAAEFEELHIELDGGVRKTRPVSPHDHNGNPKWSSKAHLMNAETDRPA
jgi:hypothetical protein